MTGWHQRAAHGHHVEWASGRRVLDFPVSEHVVFSGGIAGTGAPGDGIASEILRTPEVRFTFASCDSAWKERRRTSRYSAARNETDQYCSSQFPNLHMYSQVQVLLFQKPPFRLHSSRSNSKPSHGSGILSKVNEPPTGSRYCTP